MGFISVNAKCLLTGIVAAALSAGCSETELEAQTPAQSPALDISMPSNLIATRNVNRDVVFVEVRVNNELIVQQGNREFNQDFVFENGETVTLQVTWFETQTNGADLALSSHSSTHIITSNTTLAVSSSDYSAADFDEDTDGFNNLSEREASSDPFDPDSTPTSTNVRIGWINPNSVPVIDGLYEDAWDNAQFDDFSGETLSIDNLMIDQGADRPDGGTEFRWFSMHDDTFLYLFVVGENVDRATTFRDSTNIVQDDNLNIYLDGDNSKGSSYDGIDDRHILIPLLTSPDDLSSNSTVFVVGANSTDLPAFEFATCDCTSGQKTWEVKIPMAEYGIVKNRPFGIDMQLDDDNDGGARDAKWGWFHPSRDDQDVDFTWQDPSFMATAIVE